jgi:ABC-type ATPase involved in cell division
VLTSISLKFGRSQKAENEVIDLTPITVFVGPNNAGKSKVLLEINQRLTQGRHLATDVVLNEIGYEVLTTEESELYFDQLQLKPLINETIQLNHVILGGKGQRLQLTYDDFKNVVLNPLARPDAYAVWFLAFKSIYLNGPNRLNLINPQPMGDLKGDATFSLQNLFKDDEKRSQVRRIIFDAFGKYFVVDPTNAGQLEIRLSDRAPVDYSEERSLSDESVRFHSQAKSINEFSDGVKAFIGLLIEAVAGAPELILIDEPETFLHPALAFKLGRELSTLNLSSKKRLFISTHSPNFVMGCIQSGTKVNIVRLTYQGGQATARTLKSKDILHLMRNPLLRSTGVISALFYENVVVTESDSDRAFYQEINERLLKYDPQRAIPNCLFINAQNKQTVHLILRPLRELGIPAVGIVDVDIVKEGGTVWSNFLNGGHVSGIIRESLNGFRARIKSELESNNKDMKREGGVNILTGESLLAANHLFDQLDEHGLFVVRGGELESWVKDLQVTGHGSSWLISVFEKMGEDPSLSSYVTPQSGDVWTFISNIQRWLTNPNRKGIPV